MTIVREQGARFDDAEVARNYLHRPPYAAALYDFLGERVANHHRALDLGCGPGKIAGELATMFDQVDAVDPSLPMLQQGQSLHADASNIRWIHASSEDAVLEGPYDLVTIGTAAHWMDHAVVFPKISNMLETDGVLATIQGDRPHQPPWEATWMAFLRRWLQRVGINYDETAFGNAVTAHEPWMNIAGRKTFIFDYRQKLVDFVACQHSRATWTRIQLGNPLAAEFDAELTELLTP
ncbi:MAG: class I SAM-dependent methyltransferase, partial [Gammaproteobacteria bacterium]|nr:class I SAM-dependent methyltransferase [Gammaproteobacteria bacterium]